MGEGSGGILSEEAIARRLREGGLRVTRPRLLLYGTLAELGGHRSAEELGGVLRERGLVLSKPSIYNVLRDLESHDLIMTADAGPGRTLYEIRSEWHHHFVCRSCRHVFDVPCAVGAKPCLDSELTGFHVDEAQVIFRGECPDCGTRVPDSGSSGG